MSDATKKRVTAEMACGGYALWHREVTRLSSELGDPEYADCPKRDQETGDCIDRLFHCPRGPDDERPRWQEFYDAMCDRCRNRLALLDKRKLARGKLGAAKRTILVVGKRLLQ